MCQNQEGEGGGGAETANIIISNEETFLQASALFLSLCFVLFYKDFYWKFPTIYIIIWEKFMGAMTLRRTTLHKESQHNDSKPNDTQNNGTQHNDILHSDTVHSCILHNMTISRTENN